MSAAYQNKRTQQQSLKVDLLRISREYIKKAIMFYET
jgi:hypothetical protein